MSIADRRGNAERVCSIRTAIEKRGATLRGAAHEGVVIALKVLSECTCETCTHCHTEEVGDTFGYCQIGSHHAAVQHDHFCADWEARQ